MQKVVLAGGCFWCMEAAFMDEPGILALKVGYTGGDIEAIEILFDPQVISFLQILDIYWRHIDPFDATGQFADRGSSYQTAIFYHDDEQKKLAQYSKDSVENLFKTAVATQILKSAPFYPAQEFHQSYCLKEPDAYMRYSRTHQGCLNELWEGKKAPIGVDNLRAYLTPLQYRVTQLGGTEPPFNNLFWNNHRPGIYVDLISGEPLFSSEDKFDSQTGWPSFTQPINQDVLITQEDYKLGVLRTEVISKTSKAHLGHLFDDGPAPHYVRYCLNSAALRFIPESTIFS